MRASWWWCVWAAAGLAGCGGGGSEDPLCDVVSFPAPPSDAGEMLFVARPCDGDVADGSRDRPFSAINDAIAKASDGATIMIAAETEYPEDVFVDKSLRLLAAPADSVPEEATVTIRSTEGAGIVVGPGAGKVTLRGFIVDRGKGAGVWVQSGAEATLESMIVSNTEPDGDGNFGYGILASDGGTVNVLTSTISDSRNVGIYVSGGRATIDTVTVSGSLQGGGIRLESALGDVSINNVTVQGCASVGILVASSKATIKDATVINTPAPEAVGDAIVVLRRKNEAGDYGPGAQADIDAAVISGSARVGVLFADGAIGSLTNSTVVTNGVNAGWSAGVWLQSGAGGEKGVVISGNKIRENKFNGIGLTSGAFARIKGQNEIISTTPDLLVPDDFGLLVGQGLAVLGGAKAEIEGNRIVSNSIFGVLMDNPAAGTTLVNNDINFNSNFGLVVQRASDIPPFAKNNFEGNGQAATQILGQAELPFPVVDMDFVTP